jgi:hypothetical protein
MANPYITPETERLLTRVATTYGLPKRRNWRTGRQSINISAAIRKAAEVALQAADPAAAELQRERRQNEEMSK